MSRKFDEVYIQQQLEEVAVKIKESQQSINIACKKVRDEAVNGGLLYKFWAQNLQCLCKSRSVLDEKKALLKRYLSPASRELLAAIEEKLVVLDREAQISLTGAKEVRLVGEVEDELANYN